MIHSRLLKVVPLLAIALLFAGCASITPITSRAPYSKIVVNKPFTWGDGVLTIKINMLAGTYFLKFEDKEGGGGDVRIYYPQVTKAEELAQMIRQAIPGVAGPGETAAAVRFWGAVGGVVSADVTALAMFE